MQRHTKDNAVKAMREVLDAATTPHDCDTMAQKLTKKGLSFPGNMLFPWLMQMAERGDISRRIVKDGPGEDCIVFERPNV